MQRTTVDNSRAGRGDVTSFSVILFLIHQGTSGLRPLYNHAKMVRSLKSEVDLILYVQQEQLRFNDFIIIK